MPKADHLPTDPRFPAFRAVVESEYGGRLPDEHFLAGEQMPHEPYHTEPCRAFRMFVAGWDAALRVSTGGDCSEEPQRNPNYQWRAP